MSQCSVNRQIFLVLVLKVDSEIVCPTSEAAEKKLPGPFASIFQNSSYFIVWNERQSLILTCFRSSSTSSLAFCSGSVNLLFSAMISFICFSIRSSFFFISSTCSCQTSRTASHSHYHASTVSFDLPTKIEGDSARRLHSHPTWVNLFTPVGQVILRLFVTLTFESVVEILWCYHSNNTSPIVLSHGTIYLVCTSNF